MVIWKLDSWKPTDDKLAHFALAGWAAHLFGWQVAILAGFAIEAIEWWRWTRWNHIGPWPYLTDLPSYHDLGYDALGILLGRLVP